MHALELKDVKKVYKTGLEAVKGINFSVEKGDFFALLGPNGAGKSTTIGMMTSLVTKTSGRIKILGVDIDKDPSKAKELIGLVPQEININIFETVENILLYQAGYFGIPPALAKKRAEKYMRQLGLWEKRKDEARTLSGGYKRRVMIARALVHEPQVLILDEPTAGVDIEIRRHMWKFIRALNEDGKTIILTTHYLEEAENLCKNIAIIDKGNLIEHTSMKKLLSKLNTQSYVLDVEGDTTQLQSNKLVTIVDEQTIEVSASPGYSLQQFMKEADKQKIKVVNLRNKNNRLEELFLQLVGGER